MLQDIERQAREIRMSAASEIERIENSDPADALAPEELETANRKRAFALDAAEALGTEAFEKRQEAVLAGGDRGSVFAYWMAGQRKREAIRERRREALSDAGRPSYYSAAASVTDLDGVLGKMEEALGGDSRAAEVEAAKRKEEEAFGVESLAHYLQAGARNAYEAYAKKRYASHMRR